MKNLFNSYSILSFREGKYRFIFQEKPERNDYFEKVRLAKQPAIKGFKDELAAVLPPVRVNASAAKYLEKYSMTVDAEGNIFQDGKSIIPKHLMLDGLDFTNLYLYEGKLCIIQKRKLPVEGRELYEKEVLLYDAGANQLIHLDEDTVIINGKKKLGYDEVLEAVKGQK